MDPLPSKEKESSSFSLGGGKARGKDYAPRPGRILLNAPIMGPLLTKVRIFFVKVNHWRPSILSFSQKKGGTNVDRNFTCFDKERRVPGSGPIRQLLTDETRSGMSRSRSV